MSRFLEGVSSTLMGVITAILGYAILDGIFWNPQNYTFENGVCTAILFVFYGGIAIFLGWPKK